MPVILLIETEGRRSRRTGAGSRGGEAGRSICDSVVCCRRDEFDSLGRGHLRGAA